MHAGRRAIKPAAGGLVLALLLAGCAGAPDSLAPADWWHALEGGRIAEQRPPPPNADAPYPNLSTVPARPAPGDPAARGQISSGLLADRANAEYAAALAGPEPAPPGPLPGGRAAAPAPDDSPSASLLAASATPSRPRPAARGESAPLLPPFPAAPAGESGVPHAVAKAAGAADVAAATMPATPPPAPRIEGVDLPGRTVPGTRPVAPVPSPPRPAATVTATAVLVAFQPNAAEVSPEAQNALRTLALHRGSAPMEAIGYGDAPGGDPTGQSAALPLALARARAIAAVLTASGVPAAQVRFAAEAAGRGGAARLLD